MSPQRAAPPAVTPTERTILQMVADGATDAAIGEFLGIGRKTVNARIAKIRKKVHAPNRAAAVADAFRMGWIK